MRLTTRTFLALLFAAAFLIRLGAVLALRDIHAGPTGIASADDVEFNNLALRTARGEGYVGDQGQPTSFRAPGMPLLLAAVYALVGPHAAAGYLLFCLLGALACVLTYAVARELLAEGGARLAGALAAVYLPHVYFATTFESENVFIPFLALGVWLFMRHLKSGTAATLAGAGLALGFATLTRPFALLLLPILLAVLAVARWKQRRLRLLPAVVFTATFLAAVVPWTVRNCAVHHRFVLIATNGGSTFYGGNNERVVTERRYYGFWLSTMELPGRDLVDAAPDEVTHDKVEWRLGLDWLRSHPGAVPRLVAFKLARLAVGLPDFDGGRSWYFALRIAGYAPFFLLVLAGAARCLRHRQYGSAPWFVVHGTALATIATAVIFWGSPRFRDANLPLLMAYAVVGLQALFARKQAPATAIRSPSSLVPASAAVNTRTQGESAVLTS